MALNDTLDQMNLIDTYRTFHPKTAEYTIFLSAWETLSRRGYMLGHKTNLNKNKKSEILSRLFSEHNARRLEINYEKKTSQNTNAWSLNNILPNNQWAIEEIKEKIQKITEDK